MKAKLFFFIILLTVNISAQSAFHFSSGFENSSYLLQYELNGNTNTNYADIYGTDNTTGYNWVTGFDNNPEIGNFRIYYEVGDTLKAKASIVSDPLNINNKVLKFKMNSANVPNNGNPKGRIQAAINGNVNLKEFSFKVKLYLHPDISILRYYNGDFNWFTLMEFWNNGSNQPFPFRITLNIQKPDSRVGSPLYFGAHGQTKITTGLWDDVWDEIDTSYIVPTGEWLTFKTYFYEGDSLNGRYKVVVTDSLNNSHTLFDITDFTHHPDDSTPNGVTNFNPMKLYTSGVLIAGMQQNNAELSVYWDDFEIWTNSNILNIKDNEFSNLKIYPNPVKNMLYFEDFQEFNKIYIYNLAGKVFKRYYNINNGAINVSELPEGLYILTVIYTKGEIKSAKIIKE